MKLKDLIKLYNWLSVELTLLKLYPDQVTMVDDYRKVFERLTFLESENYNMSIVLAEYNCDLDDESEISTYVDVSGRKIENDPNTLTDSYAIEFLDWKKWLGMDLAPETIQNFSELEIIVHCLYEMTFMGYNEEEIKEQFYQINNRVEEYNNFTEEEKKDMTVSLDEIKSKIQ
jgi:hypothetical protein